MGKFQFSTGADFIAAVDYLAGIAYRSQFLQFNNMDQAKMLAVTAITSDSDMLQVCLTFDIVGKRLAKKAAAMLAEFTQRGGEYEIVSRTHELASIKLKYKGRSSDFHLSWDQIKDEDYTKDRDGKSYKPRYAQPHSRMQMLWARLVSDSIRAICPESTGGYYTPEETQDIVDAIEWKSVTTAGNLTDQSSATTTSQPTSTTVTQTATSAVATQDLVGQQVDMMISQEQQLECQSLFAMLGLTQIQIDSSLQARGVKQLAELTAEQATEIIAKLRSRLPPQDPQGVQTAGPITQELADRIQSEIKLLAQAEGGLAAIEAMQAHLQKHNLLIHQLSYAEGQTLLSAIQQKQVGAFLNLALNGPSGGQEGKA